MTETKTKAYKFDSPVQGKALANLVAPAVLWREGFLEQKRFYPGLKERLVTGCESGDRNSNELICVRLCEDDSDNCCHFTFNSYAGKPRKLFMQTRDKNLIVAVMVTSMLLCIN